MQRPIPNDPLIGMSHLAHGLDQEQVERQRARYGSNDIVQAKSSTWFDLMRDTLRDPMVWFLAVTALLFFATGDYVEAAVLCVALLPILGMDAFLHRRTQVSSAALAQRLSSVATVLRDGRAHQVRSTELVPGDIVMLKANDYVPADSLFVSGKVLQVDESALTGEAMPIKKSALGALAPGTEQPVVQSDHWAFAGTRLLTGTAKLLVAYTGQATQYGEIVRLAQASTHERTPLQQAMMSLTKTLLIAALVFCVALGVTRLVQGHGWIDAVVSAVTLAIAALPEEFPVVFTFFLGVGVYRLAQHQALVRRAVVVENIGRVSCICSDKTGTLTEGRLILAHRALAEEIDEKTLMRAAAIASRHESKDPLDIALLRATETPDVEVLATYPFSEDRRRETGVVRLSDQSTLACVKGAPETILAMCELDKAQRQDWLSRALAFASTGHKVIGFAQRSLLTANSADSEPTDGYAFLGLIAFEDPVREGAREAVDAAQAAGIRVIMVTGDHTATATAIARELGLGATADPLVVQGDELDVSNLDEIAVVARATPAQKLYLVRRLREQGEIVAVTGDGVNDAPALKGADIGIAMGERGTQAAREVASIVLMDDNFRTIVRAIAEGRQLFTNLQLSFAYLLMVHLPLVITAAWIPLAGYPLLYLPIHIVWLELIIHPTALLGFQQQARRHGLARMRPGRVANGFFEWRQWSVILLVGLVMTGVILVTYERSLSDSLDVEHARTVALGLLIAASVAVTIGLSAWRTKASLVITLAVALGSLAIMQSQYSASLLHLKPLHLDDWLIVLVISAVIGLLASVFRRFGARARWL